METAKTSFKTTEAWNTIPWTKIHRKVFKLQKRIYQATKSGQYAKARSLQKLLLKSHYAKLLAVRKVTQDNQGKKTAGIDGVKSLKTADRISLVNTIGKQKNSPLRRIWIPKPGRNEKRPLGIPTMQDRAHQALVKMVMEPYWESKFEGTSYGFRPGRSAHDAIARIYQKVNQQACWVLDADITKCFDQIDHRYLLAKLECPKDIGRTIKQWLKAGIMDNGQFSNTNEGTPQGGVISPLLANIALDGVIRDTITHFKDKTLVFVRYADDFVVLHKDKEIIEQCKTFISQWLNQVGLTLQPEKTKVRHTLETNEPGFDFLGFNIRSYHVGRHRSGKTGGYKSRLLGFKTIIKPSKAKVATHKEQVKRVIKTHKTAPQSSLIKHLNLIIKGWCNYYQGVASKETFSEIDNNLWSMLRAWVVSRCGKAGHQQIRKYFRHGDHGKWTFQTMDKYKLYYHSETPIKRHTLIRPDKSPYDGDWAYWSSRTGKSLEIPARKAKLLKRQKGKCAYCGLHFLSEDSMEEDHITPKTLGGTNTLANLQVLHKHCHDYKTARDGSLSRVNENDKEN